MDIIVYRCWDHKLYHAPCMACQNSQSSCTEKDKPIIIICIYIYVYIYIYETYDVNTSTHTARDSHLGYVEESNDHGMCYVKYDLSSLLCFSLTAPFQITFNLFYAPLLNHIYPIPCIYIHIYIYIFTWEGPHKEY